MSKIECEIEIACPIEKVYEVSQDYSVRYDWDPFPERIEYLDGANEIGIGVKVYVVAKSGISMVVEFVQVSPPGIAAIKMVEGPAILKSFAGSWRFKSLPNGNTSAVFKYTIKAKNWALPSITNLILNWYFGKNSSPHLCFTFEHRIVRPKRIKALMRLYSFTQ